MKINLDYTSKNLLRTNFIYLITFFILISSFLIATSFFIKKYYSNNLKLSTLNTEIDTYKKKKDLMEFKSQVIRSEIDLDKINTILTQLIPSQEDYFSIITTLENLSIQSNFVITSYNIIVKDSTESMLSIMIEGQGDASSFLQFLKNYKFSGGRLITIDNIEFSEAVFTGGKVRIIVYSKKVSGSKNLKNLENIDINKLEEILSKVQIVLKTEEDIPVDYKTKSNPF